MDAIRLSSLAIVAYKGPLKKNAEDSFTLNSSLFFLSLSLSLSALTRDLLNAEFVPPLQHRIWPRGAMLREFSQLFAFPQLEKSQVSPVKTGVQFCKIPENEFLLRER